MTISIVTKLSWEIKFILNLTLLERYECESVDQKQSMNYNAPRIAMILTR